MDNWLDKVNPQIHTIWHGDWRKGILEAPRFLCDHELVVVLKGHCRLELESDKIDCEGPFFFIVPPMRQHLSFASSATFRYCIHFDWELQRSVAPEPLYHFCPDTPSSESICLAPDWLPSTFWHGPIPHTSPALTLVQSLATRWVEESSLSRLTCRALLLEILIHLLATTKSIHLAKPTMYNRRTSLAMEMKNRLDFMELSSDGIQVLFQTMGFRYEHLCRIFKQVYGLSPQQYRDNIRLEKAKRFLKTGEFSVKQIAEKLQFCDAGYFCRAFKRHTGQTPKDFAQNQV
jgi:AraC-like DNA-binding protein